MIPSSSLASSHLSPTSSAVHGEGDRTKVNGLAKNARIAGLTSQGMSPAQAVAAAGEPDQPPDITVVIRDPAPGGIRIEWPVKIGKRLRASCF
jgi:hypothetical protein